MEIITSGSSLTVSAVGPTCPPLLPQSLPLRARPTPKCKEYSLGVPSHHPLGQRPQVCAKWEFINLSRTPTCQTATGALSGRSTPWPKRWLWWSTSTQMIGSCCCPKSSLLKTYRSSRCLVWSPTRSTWVDFHVSLSQFRTLWSRGQPEICPRLSWHTVI